MTRLSHNPRLIVALCSSIVLGMTCSAALAQPLSCDSRPHEFIIVPAPGVTIESILSRHSGTLGLASLAEITGRHSYLVAPRAGIDDSQALSELLGDTECESERNADHFAPEPITQSFFISIIPSDLEGQTAAQTLRLGAALQIVQGNRVIVAVLDTGISDHPGFGGRLIAGYNFIEGNTNTDDVAPGVDTNGNGAPDEKAGHGTMVASIIHTVAPMASIMPLRVMDSDGVGSAYSVAEGIYYAIDHGARVINLSLASRCPAAPNGPPNPPAIHHALQAAAAANVIVITGAGNASAPTGPNPVGSNVNPVYPARDSSVIAVAAIDQNDHRAPFSDYGDSFVSLAAPGTEIHGLFPSNRYAQADGTSLAAAWVAGAAALVIDKKPNATFAAVTTCLVETTVDIRSANPTLRNRDLGRGRLDIAAAVALACTADVCCGAEPGAIDGGVGIEDLLFYLGQFSNGAPAADVDDGSGTGTLDEGVGVEDLLYYLQRFSAGC